MKKPYVISTGPTNFLEHVIIFCHLENGVVGIGESAPAVVVSEESQGDVQITVERFLSSCAIEESVFDLEKISQKMSRAIPGHPHAKAALELSIWDAIGKVLDTPLYDLLGGKFRSAVPVAWAIGIGSEDEMVEEAKYYVSKGFRALKVKVGLGSDRDLVNLAAIRNAVGKTISIRVDANCGYSSDQALKILRKMEDYDLELIEQPLPRWDLEGLARVAGELDTPIMVDESINSPEEAMRLARMEAADIFNIKVAKLGIRASKKIAAIAEACGLSCSVGSMIETSLGTSAGANFAASTAIVTYATELVGTLLISDDLGTESYVASSGEIRVPNGPGLGIDLDYGKLKQMKTAI